MVIVSILVRGEIGIENERNRDWSIDIQLQSNLLSKGNPPVVCFEDGRKGHKSKNTLEAKKARKWNLPSKPAVC